MSKISGVDTNLTEKKILGVAACQGTVILNKSDTLDCKRVNLVLDLKKSGYLEVMDIDEDCVYYKITAKGKEYLKVLIHPNISTSKTQKELPQTTYNEVDDEEGLVDKYEKSELEVVIGKRLNILRSANKRGLDFNLTDANVRSLLKKKSCHYTGVVFGSDDDPLNVRTFERVDETKGYIHGNVVAVTLRANRIKNIILEHDTELKINVEQFVKMAEQIKKHNSKNYS